MTRDDIGFEFMLNALRLTGGVAASSFAERTGYPLSLVSRGMETATRKGLLDEDPSVLRPTALGRRFLNDLLELFLPAQKVPSAPAPVRIHLEATGVAR